MDPISDDVTSPRPTPTVKTASSSRLTFWCQGRRRRLFRKVPHGPWYVRVQYKGEDYPMCTGKTGEAGIASAKVIAINKIDAIYNGDEAALEATQLRTKPCATLGQIEERFRAGARTVPDKEQMKLKSINGYVGSLYILTETSFDHGRRTRAEGRGPALSANVLTRELVEEFKQGWLLTADHEDPRAMASARRTVNGYLRQARSMFAEEFLPLYAGLRLPDLAGFKGAKGFRKVAPTRYVPIEQGTINAMEAEIRALRPKFHLRDEDGRLSAEATTARTMYLAFFFMLWLGMRKDECLQARLGWLEEWPTGPRMAIRTQSYYRPKGIDGEVAIAPSLMTDIRELSEARAPMDFLLPAPTPTDRANAVGRDLSGLIRRHLGEERQKTCHELRKHAVSMMLMRTRNYVDTLKFSRHSDVRTLQDHYGSFLGGDLPAISSSDWRTPLTVLPDAEAMNQENRKVG